MLTVFAVAVLLVLGTTNHASALDHKNLDEGRPLRLEDAYSIATGELTIETGGGFALQRRGPSKTVRSLETFDLVLSTTSIRKRLRFRLSR